MRVLNFLTLVITRVLNYFEREGAWTRVLLLAAFFAAAFFVLVHYLSPVIK